MDTFLWQVCGVYALLDLVCRGAIARFFWREVTRLFVLFDLACLRLLQKIIRPKFVIQGSCHKRGVCCNHIIGDPPRFVKGSWLIQAYASYHLLAHRFRVVARGPNDELIFSCGHLRSDGRCGIYRTRPRICRNYPVLPFFGTPKLLPGCGYKVVPRSVAAMQQRASLPILNPTPAVHHPTPEPRPVGELERHEDFHRVDIG